MYGSSPTTTGPPPIHGNPRKRPNRPMEAP